MRSRAELGFWTGLCALWTVAGACGSTAAPDGGPVMQDAQIADDAEQEDAMDAATDATLDVGNDSGSFDVGPCADAAACPDSACGNGRLDPGEECDDFNTTPGDGCSEVCQAMEEPGEPFLVSPAPGSTLRDSTQTFMWTSGGPPLRQYDLHLGPFLGSSDYHDTDRIGVVRVSTVVDLPVDGSMIHVRLYWTDDEWETSTFNDYLLHAASL